MARRFTELAIDCADSVGQGEASWVVLTDPEGNEFCVLGDRHPCAWASPIFERWCTGARPGRR